MRRRARFWHKPLLTSRQRLFVPLFPLLRLVLLLLLLLNPLRPRLPPAPAVARICPRRRPRAGSRSFACLPSACQPLPLPLPLPLDLALTHGARSRPGHRAAAGKRRGCGRGCGLVDWRRLEGGLPALLQYARRDGGARRDAWLGPLASVAVYRQRGRLRRGRGRRRLICMCGRAGSSCGH